jgi:hypothetical protein
MAQDGLTDVFAALTEVLRPLAKQLSVSHDTPEHFYLDCKNLDAKGKAQFFAAVKIGKDKVAFHLMPIYVEPALLDSASAGLKKRMQGKSCFNFNAIDAALFQELSGLTKASFNYYKTQGKI